MQAPGPNTLPNRWHDPPADLALREGEVHLWLTRFDQPPEVLETLEPVLSEAEKEKAGRFYFEEDKRSYIASKACQRTVLGVYLGVDPGSLVFDLNPYGKPRLSGLMGEDTLQFNLSHSRGLGVLAAARGTDLGVDVERVRTREMDLGIARRFFSRQEVAVLEGLPPAEQNKAFYVCWTRKEAYIKARGEGLSFPLDKFSVSLAPNQPPALLSNEIDPAENRRWDVYHLDLGPGYIGALVIRARAWTFRQFQWPLQRGDGEAPGEL